MIVPHIVCILSPSSTSTKVSAINQEYICFYFIVFPVYYLLTLTQRQKHLLCYHILSNTMGKHCIFAINKHKGKWHYIDYLINTILFIASSTPGSTESYTVLLSDPNTVSKHLHRTFLRLFWVTYRLLVLMSLCHLLHLSIKRHISSKSKSVTLDILSL